MPRIAIVGAGVAGLTVAYSLRTRPIEVTVFEKSRGFGGRAATRGRYGCRYDHGAVSFDASTDRVERLVTAHLPTEQLVDIGRPVWTFAREGPPRRSSTSEEGPRRWSYVNGISTLGKLLARYSRSEVCRSQRIERLTQREQRWTLRTDEGRAFSGYDAVVLTAPAPQSSEILAQSEGIAVQERAREALSAVSYAPQFSYILAYDRPIERPDEMYGLASRDDAHPIDWIGFENDKPGHVPPGRTLLVVQTAPAWTRDRVDEDPESFLAEVKTKVADVLSADLQQPAWYDTQRWRYARPLSAVDPDGIAAGAERGLFFAGDSLAGTGRVSAAIETGFDAASQIRQYLGE